MNNPPVNDLCDLPIDLGTIVKTLKTRSEANLRYTYLGDSMLIAMDPSYIDEQLSTDYVAEYKNTSSTSTLPPHLFQLINKTYLHMRRTGIDQTIILSGNASNGKSLVKNWILSHLIRLGKKETKLHQQILGADILLAAFGEAKGSQNISQFGNYTELLFNERGRMIGTKIESYLLDRARIAQPEKHNFHIFYYLLAGTSPQEKEALSLHSTQTYRYLTQNNNGLSHEQRLQGYQDFKNAMRWVGLGKNQQARVIQLLATLLNLGQLQFMDNPNVQEAAIIKNRDMLELVSDGLGVDAGTLENVLTYKTQLIKKDVTTLILNAEQSSLQRDEFAITLYSALFDWLVDFLNQKLNNENAHNFIGILDFPGTVSSSSSDEGYHRLSLNYCNERIQEYIQRYVFQVQGQEYGEDGLDYPPVSSDITHHLLEHDLMHLVQSYSKKITNSSANENEFIRAVNKNLSERPSFQIFQSETGATLFSIQHFHGQQIYNPNLLLEESRITTGDSPDFVTLFKGSTGMSCNGFLSTLFDKPPMKSKGMRSALDSLFEKLDGTVPWVIYCLRSSHGSTFDSQLVHAQVVERDLVKTAIRLQTGSFLNVYTFDDFSERYSNVLTHFGIYKDTPKVQCEKLMHLMNWNIKKEADIGSTKIFLNDVAWRYLEDYLRGEEKLSRKKQKDEKRYLAQDDMSHSSSQQEILTLGGQSEYSLTKTIPQPKFRGRGSTYSLNTLSVLSEDLYDAESARDGSDTHDSFGYRDLKPVTEKLKEEEEAIEPETMSSVRKRWLFFVWCMTWWIPTPFIVWCGGMKRKDIQIAWREKLSLCMIIMFMSAFIIWFLVFFGKLVCPHQDVFSQSELQSRNTDDNAYVAIRGEVFDLTKYAPHHWANTVIPTKAITSYGGLDVTDLFPVQVSSLCQGVTGTVSDYVSLDYHFNATDKNADYHDFRAWTNDTRPDWYFEKMLYLRKNYKMGTMGFSRKEVLKQAEQKQGINGENIQRTWAILNGSVYDMTFYVRSGRHIRVPDGMDAPSDVDVNYMYEPLVDLFRQMSGKDITAYWAAIPLDPDLRLRQEVCLRNLFYVGAVDERNSPRCIFSEYLLLIVTVFLCLVIVFKFLAALQFGTHRDPQNHEKFVICQVPCYTEGEEELKKTIDSIASLKYDDKRKLLFIICDGMIVGGGNDRPTPRIVLDILGVDPHVDPEPLSFLSIGEGQKQHNMGKIYSGLYECQGHVVPYIVVTKVGKSSERQKPGNRGKRDSQLILMRFLNKVHFKAPMVPMELEIYHQIKNVIGVNPSFYEFVLMVDADTEVMGDGLNRMVSSFVHDAKIIGLCGETMLSNEKDSWVTMIQVYEYFISHYMIKAFESLFGSVTCLPGCFCMYRIRSPVRNQPLLVSNQVIEDYQINRVDTLHKKNLLHLGEDRYLTTLILKHFPTYKTKFVHDAKCATNAPDQWSVLLSQRRRWINSTIHNLGELVFLPQLCGFCCFSMRFVVMLDLVSTLVQPAIVGYLGYLIYTLATSTSTVPLMSIITIAGVYGLQSIIFIFHKKWEHIIWMIVSIFAIPVFSLWIPLYSYWHFDDFSWGNTRVVMGDKGKKMVVGAEEGHFDPKSIPTKTWEEYEEGLVKKDWQNDANSVVSKESGYTHTTYRTNGTMGRLPAYASSQYTVGSHHSFTPIASSLSLNNPNQYRSFSPINPLYRYE